MASDLSTLAKVIGTNCTAALVFNDRDSASDVLSALAAKTNVVRARIYSNDSELFAEYVRAGESGEFALTVEQQSQISFTPEHLIASEIISLDGENFGTVYLISNLDAFRSRLNRYSGVVAAVLFGSLLVAFLLSSKLQGLISDPISHLAKTARAVASDKDYTIRAVKHGNDEMGELIDGFNEMLGQIQERDARLQTARDELELRVEERTRELQDEIAERERIEHVLRRSEEHFRSLIENSTDVITILAIDGTIRYESPSVERVMGYKPEELVGRNANEFGHPDDKPALSLLLADVAGLTGDGTVSQEVRFKHRNGDWRTLEVFERLLRDESGETHIIINSRDITDRKRAAETLKESEALFRSLAETISAAIYIYKGSKFIYVNPAAETITGYTHDELMGMEVFDILHPEAVEEAKLTADLRQKGEDVRAHVETRILTKSGETRWLDIAPKLIRFQGEQATLATAFDVTERKGWEDALRESEEKYRTILQSIQEGYYEVDLAGGLTFFNDSLSRIMGTPAAKMMGLKHRAYTDPENEKKVTAAFEEVFRTGEPLEGLEYQILTLEGLTKFLESSVLLRRDSTGQVIGFRGTSREITERKMAEEALRDSEERYRALFEAATDAIMILDTEGDRAGRILAANRAAAETTGYTVEELLELNISELRVPEEAVNVARDLQLVLRGNTRAIEISRRRKDGSTFPVEVNASPVNLGENRCVLVFARDMTQRKQMEKEATMLAHAVRSIQECVSITDNEQHVLFVNDAFVKTYGFERHELLGKQLQDLVRVKRPSDPDDERFARSPEQAWEGELLNRRKDGTIFPVNLRVSPIHDDSGQTIALAGIGQDITERKKIEKEVSMLAHTVRSIRESVCITDAEDNLLFVNDAFLTLYGYDRAEVIGENIFDLVRIPDSSPNATNDIPPAEFIRRWNGELFNRRKDGTEFPIHLSSSLISDGTGETLALVGVIQDITESKRAIEELQNAKDAAEAASHAKSEFLANMSHEIRTPMNGIIGMTELALDTELNPEQAEYLTLVKLSADSLLGVINDILDFSKIEAGKLELDFEDFNLQDCVDEVMKALSVRADQKGLELAYYLRPGVPERIIGDPGRLRQVLVNLVGNAIKFTDLGEVILGIEAETHPGKEVFLHFGIRDTGIGVPIEKQKVIFDSFTQADGSTTRKYGGTGLGLAISSQLVEMMGGKIWVESPVVIANEPLQGSLFHFTAGFTLARGSVQTEQATYLSELAGLPVLVVDDNATNRRILEVQLTNWQMKSTGIEKPGAALALIREAAAAGTPFKLALLDFHMPEIDGLTLAQQIRNDPDGRDIRIIIMSSSVQQNQARHRNWNIDAKLVKPVKAAELFSMIRQVMAGNDRSTPQTRQAARTSAHPGRVLLAEDNRVNQQLIKRLLEKWGHTAILAHNGKEALSMLEGEKFDCVLMDLQMPEINGFEATAIIRSRERRSGTHTPIIALTAHALKGDRERCIDAGMDEYVSKPIEAVKLFDIIESVVNSRSVPEHNRRSTDAKAIDIEAIINHFDGDVDLLATLAAIFADSSAIQLTEMKAALARGDAEALGRAAHSLKGSVSNFHAQVAVEAAATLEQMARSGDLARADSVFAVLKDQIEQLRKELETLEEVSLS